MFNGEYGIFSFLFECTRIQHEMCLNLNET
jgi:hypothetical protein